MATDSGALPFGARLRAAVKARVPLCVGIDPHASLLSRWGLDDDPSGVERLALTCVEAVAGEVVVVKLQSAFFERHGSAGVAVLERTIAAAKAVDLLVILDVKRGDVDSTAAAYADAYLNPSSALAADAITVSPFLGFGSLRPFFDVARAHGTGVFVLARTSNPDGDEVQGARTGAGTVAASVLSQLRDLNAGAEPMGSFGAVVGGTLAELSEDVAINGPLLVPGLGAQGATAGDVRRLLGHVWDQVLPSSSRGILAAGPAPGAVRAAVREVAASLAG